MIRGLMKKDSAHACGYHKICKNSELYPVLCCFVGSERLRATGRKGRQECEHPKGNKNNLCFFLITLNFLYTFNLEIRRGMLVSLFLIFDSCIRHIYRYV